MDCQQQALDFAARYGVKLTIISSHYGQMNYDSTNRWIFKLRLTRGSKRYTFDFGQSVYSGEEEPTMYDVLACITKCDPGKFQYFCKEYGYDPYDEVSKRIYNAVMKQWVAVERLFGDIIEELQEIN